MVIAESREGIVILIQLFISINMGTFAIYNTRESAVIESQYHILIKESV